MRIFLPILLLLALSVSACDDSPVSADLPGSDGDIEYDFHTTDGDESGDSDAATDGDSEVGVENEPEDLSDGDESELDFPEDDGDFDEEAEHTDFDFDEVAEEDLETEPDLEPEPEIEEPPVLFPPDNFGAFAMGEMDFNWRDFSRGGLLGKAIDTKVWYPAIHPPGASYPVRYLGVLEGLAHPDLVPDPIGAPYPLVLFSHGNKGINFQSFTFTSTLASHGFIVAAPNHTGNTLFDDPSDEQVAAIALDRPIDIAFVQNMIYQETNSPNSPLYGMVDLSRVAVVGHSFGGYTALVLAGGTVDVDAASARCNTGIEADIFCPYIGYWPVGATVTRPPGMANLMAAVAMAPGGYAAFGEDGVANIDVPLMIMGGTLDEFLRPELRPLYEAAPLPKAKVEIDRMGHMGFTDICRLLGVGLIPTLGDMCDPAVFINVDRGWQIINPFAIAFLRYYLNGETGMRHWMNADYAAGIPEVGFESEGTPSR